MKLESIPFAFKILTKDILAQLVNVLLKQGWSCYKIAQRVNCSTEEIRRLRDHPKCISVDIKFIPYNETILIDV